jgi:hypothetical protein
MTLPRRKTRTFEKNFVSSLYLRQTRKSNSNLDSKFVKNFSKQELFRAATKMKGLKPVSSFAAFPSLCKTKQGPLAKLIRTVDPLEYANTSNFGASSAFIFSTNSPTKSSHFNLRATPSSPKSFRDRRRKPCMEKSLENFTQSSRISALQTQPRFDTMMETVAAIGSGNLGGGADGGGKVDSADNVNNGVTSTNPESEVNEAWNITDQDSNAGWAKNVDNDSVPAPIPFTSEASATSEATAERTGKAKKQTAAAADGGLSGLSINSASTPSIVTAVKAGKRTPFKILTRKSAKSEAKGKNRQTTYGTDQTLDSISLLPSWPKRTTGTSYVKKIEKKLNSSIEGNRKEIKRKTMGTKQSRNASIKKIERIHEQKLRYNGHADGHAEDKSHNVKTRLALMPRPLSRSNKRNHKSKAMTIIRSRSSTPFNTNIEGEIWSNEIMPWDNNDNTGIVEHLQKQWHAEDVKGGVKSAMKTKVIDQRPMSAKQRESMARTEADVATKTTFSAANSPRIIVPSSVRINISVLAILATIKMSFEVNGKLLTKSSNGWEEINIADELLLAMRATLDRDAKNIMGVSSSRNASFDWQNAHGQWEPLISGASMKEAVHDQFHNMPLENERPKDDKGLNLIIRIRPKNQQSLPDDESQLKSTSLSVHDGNVGNNLLQSRGKSRGSVGYSRSSSRQSSRQSISRGMSRDMLESLKSK